VVARVVVVSGYHTGGTVLKKGPLFRSMFPKIFDDPLEDITSANENNRCCDAERRSRDSILFEEEEGGYEEYV